MITRVGRVLKSRPVRDYALMSVGIALTAWGLAAFLVPNKIAAGGVSGLATIVYHLGKVAGLNLPVGLQVLLMNVVLLLVAARLRGLHFAAKTIFGIIALSALLEAFMVFTPPLAPNDLLLASLYGGVVCGLGVGLVFKAGGTTGGTDIVAALVASKVPLGMGQIMFGVDAVVTLCAALAFGPQLAMYGAVAIFVQMAAIDLVLEGVSVEKAVWIISDEADAIGQAINAELGRGATRVEATGVYTGEARGMLMIVLARNELDDLKAIVSSLDPTAMVVISNVHETIGEGFKEMSR